MSNNKKPRKTVDTNEILLQVNDRFHAIYLMIFLVEEVIGQIWASEIEIQQEFFILNKVTGNSDDKRVKSGGLPVS